MSGVERVEYMDNQRSQILTETYQREKRIQRQYFKEQEAAGRIIPVPPTPPQVHKSLLETQGVPEYVTTLYQDPEQRMASTISKNIWKSNPGYIQRDGLHQTSAMKQDFVWDQEEIDFMKEQGLLDKKHNRRRDEFVSYVEAAAKMKHLYKNQASPAK